MLEDCTDTINGNHKFVTHEPKLIHNQAEAFVLDDMSQAENKSIYSNYHFEIECFPAYQLIM